ncbi:cell cycle checkpoint protein RAD17 [Cucurbita pepo subsp. pepo]|uniref:cell cycle checkpoint protein RAD17 n=1 Tax=Cucurbita pepo subsp. pepo TaxID=3664 RepID=UPI000C9D888F|nr:cell cycle checkpoint protein RAD17 [Cucurbita pepo subsp. pepo]
MTKKENNLVVLSSDEEYCGGRSSSSKRRYRKTKSQSPLPRKSTRQAKKARLLGSRSCLHKDSRNVDEFNLFCEDFDQVFSTFKVSAGSGGMCRNELWIDKYKPHSLEELAVHKKKVDEVKVWFEDRLRTPKDANGNNVLVINGPSGVGKSATVHVIASHLGAKLCEWDTPTPVIWQEHLHNSSLGIQYTSKLDEFENFIGRMRKYGVIPSCFPNDSKQPIILLIDELPLTNGKAALKRLQNCLHLYVQSTQVPTAIVITDCAKVEGTDLTVQYLEELQLCLENAGACKVAFNPITNNSIKKIISRICCQEQYSLAVEQIDAIAKSSGGDVRHAIMSLQLFCLKPSQICSSSSSALESSKENEEVPPTVVDDRFSFQFGRDESLSLFHALGKFLHNKRHTSNELVLDGEFSVKENLSRRPLNMDPPEKVLSQAHGQARPIADFLHENVLDFMNEEAVDDAWVVASYLGDADTLLSSYERMLARHNDAENILHLAAASVAVRGVLFGNSHPLSSRWHAIRRPKLWQIEGSSLSNKREMVKQRFMAYGGISSADFSVVATEYVPALKWLGSSASGDRENLPVLSDENTDFDLVNSGNGESHTSDEEIEDW